MAKMDSARERRMLDIDGRKAKERCMYWKQSAWQRNPQRRSLQAKSNFSFYTLGVCRFDAAPRSRRCVAKSLETKIGLALISYSCSGGGGCAARRTHCASAMFVVLLFSFRVSHFPTSEEV